jgi:hypothetical protein
MAEASYMHKWIRAGKILGGFAVFSGYTERPGQSFEPTQCRYFGIQPEKVISYKG